MVLACYCSMGPGMASCAPHAYADAQWPNADPTATLRLWTIRLTNEARPRREGGITVPLRCMGPSPRDHGEYYVYIYIYIYIHVYIYIYIYIYVWGLHHVTTEYQPLPVHRRGEGILSSTEGLSIISSLVLLVVVVIVIVIVRVNRRTRRHGGTEAQRHGGTEARRHRGTETRRHRGTETTQTHRLHDRSLYTTTNK